MDYVYIKIMDPNVVLHFAILIDNESKMYLLFVNHIEWIYIANKKHLHIIFCTMTVHVIVHIAQCSITGQGNQVVRALAVTWVSTTLKQKPYMWIKSFAIWWCNECIFQSLRTVVIKSDIHFFLVFLYYNGLNKIFVTFLSKALIEINGHKQLLCQIWVSVLSPLQILITIDLMPSWT